MSVRSDERASVAAGSGPAAEQLPTKESPEHGAICLKGVVLSEVAYWVEDGDHVFRSTEFDLIAGDPDRDAAIGKFVDYARDLVGLYTDLDIEEVTPAELEIAMTLVSRLNAAYQQVTDELEAERRRLVVFPRLRNREHRTTGWYRRSRPTSSSRT